MATDETRDFCSFCGWTLKIVRTEQQGHKTVKWCDACNTQQGRAPEVVSQKLPGPVSELLARATGIRPKELELDEALFKKWGLMNLLAGIWCGLGIGLAVGVWIARTFPA